MIEASTFLSPLLKRAGENIADRLTKKSTNAALGKADAKLVETDSEVERLRTENEQLRTYIFMILGLLGEARSKIEDRR